MRYDDIDPQDIDPETNRPYANYSSPALDTSFHDNEMAVDLTPEERMIAELEEADSELAEWAREQVSEGATCSDLVAKLRRAAELAGR